MAPSRAKSCKKKDTPIPEGWILADHVRHDGEVVKCYTNVIGQKFFSMKDLCRYVEFAKREQLSIYKPGFNPSDLADTGSEGEESSTKDVTPYNVENFGSNSRAKRRLFELKCDMNPPTVAEDTEHTGEACKKGKSTAFPSTSSQDLGGNGAASSASGAVPRRSRRLALLRNENLSKCPTTK